MSCIQHCAVTKFKGTNVHPAKVKLVAGKSTVVPGIYPVDPAIENR
eukprot:SAG11_NODE_5283_length_1606_cov_2.936297_1_plen_45_part_10